MSKSIFLTKNKTGSRKKQAGMTGVAVMLILLVIGFFVFIGLKIFPVYMESFKVNSALDSLKSQADLGKKPTGEIVKSLLKKLQIDDVESVTKKEISIEKSKTGVTVYVDYEVVQPLFSNISLLVVFEKQVEILR